MPLSVVVGSPVNAVIDGHSTTNGAVIPDSAVVSLVSDNPAVGSVPASVTVPTGGAQELVVPVTAVSAGTANISVTVMVGSTPFTATDVLTVTAAVVSLDHVTLTLMGSVTP